MLSGSNFTKKMITLLIIFTDAPEPSCRCLKQRVQQGFDDRGQRAENGRYTGNNPNGPVQALLLNNYLPSTQHCKEYNETYQ
jgi:hypothetical protein